MRNRQTIKQKIPQYLNKSIKGHEEGFTIVEILVVILILGILSAIAIPIYLNQRASAIDAGLKSDIKNMAMEIDTWKVGSDTDIEEMQRNPDLNGWTIVAQNAPDTPFIGLGDKTTNYAPEGFRLPKVSVGVAMGVLTNPVSTKGGYCIVANSNGGTYVPTTAPPSGVSKFSHELKSSLFYDSRAGGLLESTELSPDGACGSYQKRIATGV